MWAEFPLCPEVSMAFTVLVFAELSAAQHNVEILGNTNWPRDMESVLEIQLYL
jgi:hypothetical protein